MANYHLALAGETEAVCNEAQPGEPVVPWDEAHDPAGRHFNCVACHRTLTGDQRHVPPPDGWPGDE